MRYRICAIIPVYNHGDTVESVLNVITENGLDTILVDDGNNAMTRAILNDISRRHDNCLLVRLESNSGKGGAVIAGLKEAFNLGYTHALQVDADGQHDLDKISEFLKHSSANPDSLVAGFPQYDERAPRSRITGRQITNFFVSLETLSRDIPDAMCGFRIYPIEVALRSLKTLHIDKRMGFDIEILVRIHWLKTPIDFLNIKVDYPDGGISNFRMVRDNISISLVHIKLLFGMIFRLPNLIIRSIHKIKR